MKLLEVVDLKVNFSVHGTPLRAVRGISFDVEEGESVGIVGESGCGKTAAVQALIRLNEAKSSGKVFFEGKNLLELKEAELRALRGQKIGYVFQDPMTSLNPTMKIGEQIGEGLIYHGLMNRKDAFAKALELLTVVGVPEPRARLSQYAHQLSGGMRQRVLIAIALSCNPRLLIADEPTTALDAAIQLQILDLLKQMQKRFQTSLLLISHDLSLVAKLCDRILVMYAGKIIEQGPRDEILLRPKHPYTQMLLRSRPKCKTEKIYAIEGSPPNLLNPVVGCAFRERCPFAMEICKQEPTLKNGVACWREDASS